MSGSWLRAIEIVAFVLSIRLHRDERNLRKI
jgi:hypothetical protein